MIEQSSMWTENRPCEDCGGTVIPNPDGRAELTCERCGLIAVSGLIDYNPATQRGDTYLGPGGDGHGPALASPTPVTMTTINGNPTRDASGRSLDPDAAGRMRYLRTVDSRVVSRRDRTSKRLYDAVHDLSLRLDLPAEVGDRAFRLARQAVEAKAFPGWEFSLVAGGCAFFATVEANGHANVAAIAAAVHASRPAEVEKNLRVAMKRLKRVTGTEPARASPERIASDALAALGLPADLMSLVRQNLTRIPASARPNIDAGAALWQSCAQNGTPVSQRRIAEAVGTTDVSLRKRLGGEPSNTRDEIGGAQ